MNVRPCYLCAKGTDDTGRPAICRLCRWVHIEWDKQPEPVVNTPSAVAESKKLEPEDVVTDLGWTSGPRWNTDDWEY